MCRGSEGGDIGVHSALPSSLDTFWGSVSGPNLLQHHITTAALSRTASEFRATRYIPVPVESGKVSHLSPLWYTLLAITRRLLPPTGTVLSNIYGTGS